MKMSINTIVDAPRQKVFDHAIDVARWPEVVSAIENVEVLTSGPVGVGTTIRETRMMWGQSASEDMTFSEIVPGELFVLTAHSHGTAYRTEHIFEDVGEGTRMTVLFEGKPTTLVAWLFMPLGLVMAGSLRKMIAQDLADIKSVVERAG